MRAFHPVLKEMFTFKTGRDVYIHTYICTHIHVCIPVCYYCPQATQPLVQEVLLHVNNKAGLYPDLTNQHNSTMPTYNVSTVNVVHGSLLFVCLFRTSFVNSGSMPPIVVA